VLAGKADILLDAYRPGSLARRGYNVADLHRRYPRIVSVSLSAFSPQGPWHGRRGYDSLVQATMGMAMAQQGDRPKLLPCQPLDYLTGYLAAFAAMVALIRRHERGGCWHATLSLAATAQWMYRMRDALGDNPAHPAANPHFAAIKDLLDTHDTAFGRVAALMPALRFDGERAAWRRMPVPLGSDPARWPGV
jgi:crotonobetainyl-CoA:carnitine CoA-transferase CaiB-like acyl-CoA transferase